MEERRFVRCEGGPSWTRLVHGEPPVEIEEPTGTYVLVDDDPDDVHYLFVERDG